ncbi:MAG: hypothetical protein J6V34_01835 [Oscillospiraceae bacterium]|nr:hypothetical protein [Oscillospiraceae bacterium]
MKKILAMVLALMMVMALSGCGGNDTVETTPPTYLSGTYVMESYTCNGESLGEEVLALYAGSQYVMKEDGTCVYTVSMHGTVTQTPGTHAVHGQKLTVHLDYGKEGRVELIFTISGDTFSFIEEVGNDTYVQTYKKQG